MRYNNKKTKKISRQNKNTDKTGHSKTTKPILRASKGRMVENIPPTGWQGNNNFGAKYGNEENITEKPNRLLRWGWHYYYYYYYFLGFWFKLVLRWLRWYYVGCYPLAKCWWKIKEREKNEDVVRFCMKVLMVAWSKGFTLVYWESRREKRRKEVVTVYHLIYFQLGSLGLEE